MKRLIGRQIASDDEARTKFPKPVWDAEAKRQHLCYSFIQPMRFKDTKIDVRECSDKKVEEIFSFFFHGVK